MSRISILTNPDKLVEEKANFFADWFHYFTSNIGESYEFELENPLALVDKIIYQLENNLKYCYPYVTNYLTHPYVTDDRYLPMFSTFQSVKKNLQSFNSKTDKERKKFIRTVPQDFIECFRLLSEELDSRMFELSLSSVISYLRCPHQLGEHLDDIKFHTQILVAEYLFRGRDKSDLNSAFSQILSDGINTFPFPKHIVKEEDKIEHIKNRGLDGQFKGLQNLLEQSGTRWTFYFKTFGAEFDKNFSFKYKEVTLYSKDHPQFDSIRAEYEFFFSDQPNYFICSIPLNFYSSTIAVKEAMEKIKRELVYVSEVLERDFILDNSRNYLVESNNNFREAWSTEQLLKKFDGEVLEKLRDNPFTFLENNKSNAARHLLEFEYILLYSSREKSMPGFWHYLETLLQFNKDENELQEKVSTILLLDEKKLRERSVIRNLFLTIDYWTLPAHRLGLTWEEIRDIQKTLLKNELPDKIRFIDYPFVKHLLLKIDTELNSTEFKCAKGYYIRILKEGYAQRNFYIHKGTSNQKANLKLSHSLPSVVRRFRWILFDELKQHSVIEFNELINLLYEKAIKLLA